MKQPVDLEKIETLVAELREKNEAVPDTWFVDWNGQPLWAQSRMPFAMIAGGMRIQPRMDGPEYRIVDFEDCPDHKITIVRVSLVGTDEDRDYLEKQLGEPDESEWAHDVQEDDLVLGLPVRQDVRDQTRPKSFTRSLFDRLKGWFGRVRREKE